MRAQIQYHRLGSKFKIASRLPSGARTTFGAFLDYRCEKLIHLKLYDYSLTERD